MCNLDRKRFSGISMSRIQGQATYRRQSALRVFAERLPAKRSSNNNFPELW
jgi:hypothetical protein